MPIPHGAFKEKKKAGSILLRFSGVESTPPQCQRPVIMLFGGDPSPTDVLFCILQSRPGFDSGIHELQ